MLCNVLPMARVLDAFSSLIIHVDERPTLMTICGSDIALDDTAGWARVKEHVESVGREFGCENLFIRSSFRRFLNEGALTRVVKPPADDGWWHEFQHGIGLLGHAAPYAFLHRLSRIYIASSFTSADKGKITCASDPTIDNHPAVASCRTVHDGYEFSRQDKVHNICEYKARTARTIRLRVCWKSRGSGNCCRCEKCWRTILGLWAERAEPQDFGFEYGDWHELLQLIVVNRKEFEYHGVSRYQPIIEAMHKNYRREEVPQELRRLYDTTF